MTVDTPLLVQPASNPYRKFVYGLMGVSTMMNAICAGIIFSTFSIKDVPTAINLSTVCSKVVLYGGLPATFLAWMSGRAVIRKINDNHPSENRKLTLYLLLQMLMTYAATVAIFFPIGKCDAVNHDDCEILAERFLYLWGADFGLACLGIIQGCTPARVVNPPPPIQNNLQHVV